MQMGAREGIGPGFRVVGGEMAFVSFWFWRRDGIERFKEED